MNFLDHSNETLNGSSRTLNSRKFWIMGWTMGSKRACLEVIIFCNKDMSSSLTSSLWSNIKMCCFVIVKFFPLSIDFSTPSLSFPFEVNHFLKEDLESISNGLECSLAFYGMHEENVKQLSISYAFPLQSKCEAKGVVQTIECTYLFEVSWILGYLSVFHCLA